jgi:hypothetical protein
VRLADSRAGDSPEYPAKIIRKQLKKEYNYDYHAGKRGREYRESSQEV